jgi:hypothetical protein
VTPLLLKILVPFLLFWLLVGGVMLVWRYWPRRAGPLAVAAALACLAGVIILKSKWLAVLAVVAGVVALSLAARRPPGRR